MAACAQGFALGFRSASFQGESNLRRRPRRDGSRSEGGGDGWEASEESLRRTGRGNGRSVVGEMVLDSEAALWAIDGQPDGAESDGLRGSGGVPIVNDATVPTDGRYSSTFVASNGLRQHFALTWRGGGGLRLPRTSQCRLRATEHECVRRDGGKSKPTAH
jgi:hypothetical protein